jgi:hypothetical protein
MKRFFFSILLMGALVVFMEPAGKLLSTILHLEQPTSHEIQTGEWLSKLAVKYYGDASYWRELALVNRAPNGDLIFPGEKVIVPSFEAIRQIRRSHSMSAVNEVVDMQETILAGKMRETSQPVAERPYQPESESANGGLSQKELTSESPGESMLPTDEEFAGTEKSFFLSTPFLTGAVILAVILAMGIFMYARKKKREEASFYGTAHEKKDAELETEEEKSSYFFGERREEKEGKNGSKRHQEVEVVK